MFNQNKYNTVQYNTKPSKFLDYGGMTFILSIKGVEYTSSALIEAIKSIKVGGVNTQINIIQE